MEGRSRLTPERETEVFAVALGPLREHGYVGLVMRQVAEASRSSTATPYRRWGGKPKLLVEAMSYRRPPPADIDTGSLRGDLLEGARRMAAVSDDDGALVVAVTRAARSDTELADALNEALAQPMAEAANAILDRAVPRGEIAATAPGAPDRTALSRHDDPPPHHRHRPRRGPPRAVRRRRPHSHAWSPLT